MTFEGVKRNWAAILLIAAIAGAGGTAYRQWDALAAEVAANTTERLLQTYDRLLRKLRAEGGLGPRDAAKFCSAARRLGIGGADVRRVCG